MKVTFIIKKQPSDMIQNQWLQSMYALETAGN